MVGDKDPEAILQDPEAILRYNDFKSLFQSRRNAFIFLVSVLQYFQSSYFSRDTKRENRLKIAKKWIF